MEGKTGEGKLTIASSILVWAANLSDRRKWKVSDEMEGENVGRKTDKCFVWLFFSAEGMHCFICFSWRIQRIPYSFYFSFSDLTPTLSPIVLVSSNICSSIFQNPHLPIAQVQISSLFHLLFTLARSLWLAKPKWHSGLSIYTPPPSSHVIHLRFWASVQGWEEWEDDGMERETDGNASFRIERWWNGGRDR